MIKNDYDDILNKNCILNTYDEVKYRLYGSRIRDVKVSIMIPTFKRVECLYKAIESAIKQKTSVPFEVVIVDNNPETEDATIENILKLYSDSRISYYKNEKNIGMFGNWNRCISLANAEWIIILSDDDELKEDYIETTYNIINHNPKCTAISVRHQYIDSDERIIKSKKHIWDMYRKDRISVISINDFYLIHPINIYGCIFNKKKAIEIGGFREELYPCSDAAFLMHMSLKNELILLNTPLFYYRWAVNESKKVDTQINFLRFNNAKCLQINRKQKLFSAHTDYYLRNCMIDYNLRPLIKKCIIDRNMVREIKKEMGIREKYSVINVVLFAFIVRYLNIKLLKKKGK